ncbi:hypothetical protein [Nocardia mexicana]|uniref:Uncharacterized protein n=1 Tax=Nocardia mexicana TaxID=279262 RepID=A0A370H5W2_9NOCA|nr:hypothetical protein [Nocardia mexicana]RDI51807.1 hypothetical protein DFR68_104291 [Nocardia mexicana]
MPDGYLESCRNGAGSLRRPESRRSGPLSTAHVVAARFSAGILTEEAANSGQERAGMTGVAQRDSGMTGVP